MDLTDPASCVCQQAWSLTLLALYTPQLFPDA
jgi:hypothetical protein